VWGGGDVVGGVAPGGGGGGGFFRAHANWPWGPPSLLYNGYLFSFPALKRPGRNVDHPPISSAEAKENVELLLPFWGFMACPEVNIFLKSSHITLIIEHKVKILKNQGYERICQHCQKVILGTYVLKIFSQILRN
jgi:hypothetical protein